MFEHSIVSWIGLETAVEPLWTTSRRLIAVPKSTKLQIGRTLWDPGFFLHDIYSSHLKYATQSK